MIESFATGTLFIGNQLIRLSSVPSTNDFLKKKISENRSLAEGLSVLTAYQTSGRGQIGNAWESEGGKNILLSVYLKPHWLPLSRFFQLNMSVCLALIDTLNHFQAGFKIKWPNDILFDRRKIAGILIENTISNNALASSVVGMGLNINQENFPAGLRTAATSLKKLCGQTLDLEVVLALLLQKLEHRYLQLRQNSRQLRHDYFDHLYGFNETIRVEQQGKVMEATLVDVQQDGQLVLRLGGVLKQFQFKEISFVL